MAKIQEVFDKIQTIKDKQKKIKAVYRDALKNSAAYEKAMDEYNTAKGRKKQIEDSIKSDFSKELEELEEIKYDLETENILLSDIALNHIMKGETIEITDSYNNKYEPLFTVKFRKV